MLRFFIINNYFPRELLINLIELSINCQKKKKNSLDWQSTVLKNQMITIVARFSTKLSTIVATWLRFVFFSPLSLSLSLFLSRLTDVSWPQNDRNSLGAENARCNLNPRSPSVTRTTPMNRWKSLFSSRYATRYSFWYPKVCARSKFLGETKDREPRMFLSTALHL